MDCRLLFTARCVIDEISAGYAGSIVGSLCAHHLDMHDDDAARLRTFLHDAFVTRTASRPEDVQVEFREEEIVVHVDGHAWVCVVTGEDDEVLVFKHRGLKFRIRRPEGV